MLALSAATHLTVCAISWLACDAYRHGQGYAVGSLVFIVGIFIVSVGTL